MKVNGIRMYVRMYVHRGYALCYVCTYVRVYICTVCMRCLLQYMYEYTNMYFPILSYVKTCTYVFLPACTHVICLLQYIRTYVPSYIRMYVRMYEHTKMDFYIQWELVIKKSLTVNVCILQ